jgi:carbon monoxide dehydrogenase subunit G
MKVHGTGTMLAAPNPVWAALGDPGLLARAVPALDQIDFPRDGTCRFTLTTTIAAVSGSYTGEASVVERPESYVRVLRVSATGVRGKVGADVTIRVAPAGEGATELSYVADADVEGAIAGIGQRMLASIAKRIAADAIAALDAALAAGPPAEALAAQAPPAEAPPADAPRAKAPAARTGPEAQTQDGTDGQTAIEQARRGIGLRGERVPVAGRPGPAVRTGLVAGAGAAAAAIVVGVLIRKRRGRR